MPAASLFSRKQGLGVPIHIKMSFILINIDYYTLWVLNRVLYINYIALAIDPFLGCPFMSRARARPRPMCGGRGAVRPRGRGAVRRGAPQRGPSTWGGDSQ